MAEGATTGVSSQAPAPPKALGWLLIAAVVAMPLVALDSAQPAIALSEKRGLHLTLFDLIVCPAALWLVIWRWRYGRGEESAGEPWLRSWLMAVWPGLLLFGAGAFSILQIGDISRHGLLLAAKNAWQCLEYLAVFPLLALAFLGTPAWRQRLCRALFLAAALAVGTALRDFFVWARAGDSGIPHLVGGCLGNRYAYTLFVSLALCLMWEETSLPAWRIWRWLFAFAAFYPALAAGPLLAGLAGLAFAALAQSPRALLPLLALVAALAFSPPAEARGLRSRSLARSMQVYVPFRHPETGNIESTHTLRYYRWAAEINQIAARPWGAGWGKYQSAVNERLGDLPVPKIQSKALAAYDVLAHEPMSFSWFLQAGVEMGVPGLVAVFVFILEMLARSGGWRSGRAMAPGVAGAAIALLLAGLWTSPMARGVGPLLGLLLALSHEWRGGRKEMA